LLATKSNFTEEGLSAFVFFSNVTLMPVGAFFRQSWPFAFSQFFSLTCAVALPATPLPRANPLHL